MPRKKKSLQKTEEEIRKQIDVLSLIEALENHVIHGAEMTSTQVSAALALLKKTLPDIAADKKAGKEDPVEKALRHEDALEKLK